MVRRPARIARISPSDIWPEFKKTYVDTGKVRFIFREYSRNNLDVGAFMLARCVGDDKAYATIELLFASQDAWAFGNNPLEGLMTALRPTGMSRDKATACLNDQAKADAFAQDRQDGGRQVQDHGHADLHHRRQSLWRRAQPRRIERDSEADREI